MTDCKELKKMIKLFLLASYLVLLVLQIEPICANNIRESDVFGIKRSESAKVAQMNCEQSSIIEHRDETQTVDIRFPAIKVTQVYIKHLYMVLFLIPNWNSWRIS